MRLSHNFVKLPSSFVIHEDLLVGGLIGRVWLCLDFYDRFASLEPYHAALLFVEQQPKQGSLNPSGADESDHIKRVIELGLRQNEQVLPFFVQA